MEGEEEYVHGWRILQRVMGRRLMQETGIVKLGINLCFISCEPDICFFVVRLLFKFKIFNWYTILNTTPFFRMGSRANPCKAPQNEASPELKL